MSVIILGRCHLQKIMISGRTIIVLLLVSLIPLSSSFLFQQNNKNIIHHPHRRRHQRYSLNYKYYHHNQRYSGQQHHYHSSKRLRLIRKMENGDNDNDDDNNDNNNNVSKIIFRTPTVDDIPRCLEIEEASYPSDEAASFESLTYRQKHALEYFQCACIIGNDDDDSSDNNKKIIGFICSTRCNTFEDEDAMVTHDPNGSLLAIHSVVVEKPYRRQGIASKMLRQYIDTIKKQQQQQEEEESAAIESIVLLAKSHLLGFYVQAGGFRVNRPSPIVHGKDTWYELELPLVVVEPEEPKIIMQPSSNQSWFCKTEQFCKPYPIVKPFLAEHVEWVTKLRNDGVVITSGYRVDQEGKPGGGGLMFIAAANYQEALELVKQDPLVANDCVDWELNGWIGQVGNLALI